MPLFTVAIPTYNRAEMLTHTIACVLQQTFGDFELVISDNGSPDHTAEAVARFRDPRIRYIRHPENRGGMFNWSHCTDVAVGDWFVFNQDDDLLCPFFLERCANAIRKHPDIVMYATECTMSRDVRSLFRTSIGNFPLHHHWDKTQPRIIPGLQVAAMTFFTTGFFPPAQAFPTPLIRKHFPRRDGELLADRYITWRIAIEGDVAFEAYIGALLGDHGTRYTVTHAESCNRSPSVNAERMAAHCQEHHLDWQSALRNMVPEMPREFRDWVLETQILVRNIPTEAFEIVAEDHAREQGISPAEWVMQKKAQKIRDLQPPAPPPVPRLDRLGLPRPMIRVLRKILSLLGKKY
jgi:hypothetical protein